MRRPSSFADNARRHCKERGGKMNTASERGRVHSSDRRRAAGLVTLMPNAFALCRQRASVGFFPWGGEVDEMVIVPLRRSSTKGNTHRAKMVILFRLETPCAISAANFLLCISKRSTSLRLLTTNFLRPLGKRCRVYRYQPIISAYVEKNIRDGCVVESIHTFLLLP